MEIASPKNVTIIKKIIQRSRLPTYDDVQRDVINDNSYLALRICSQISHQRLKGTS